jgi:hypothetical protein
MPGTRTGWALRSRSGRTTRQGAELVSQPSLHQDRLTRRPLPVLSAVLSEGRATAGLCAAATRQRGRCAGGNDTPECDRGHQVCDGDALRGLTAVQRQVHATRRSHQQLSMPRYRNRPCSCKADMASPRLLTHTWYQTIFSCYTPPGGQYWGRVWSRPWYVWRRKRSKGPESKNPADNWYQLSDDRQSREPRTQGHQSRARSSGSESPQL